MCDSSPAYGRLLSLNNFVYLFIGDETKKIPPTNNHDIKAPRQCRPPPSRLFEFLSKIIFQDKITLILLYSLHTFGESILKDGRAITIKIFSMRYVVLTLNILWPWPLKNCNCNCDCNRCNYYCNCNCKLTVLGVAISSHYGRGRRRQYGRAICPRPICVRAILFKAVDIRQPITRFNNTRHVTWFCTNHMLPVRDKI